MSGQAQAPPDDTAQKEKKRGQSDDKCIGNRKIRTILLCLILGAFSIFAAGYLLLRVEAAKDAANAVQGCAACKEAADSQVHGANMIVAGLFFILIFCLLTMIMVNLKACDPNKTKGGCLPGIGLIIGSVMYILGWVWYISEDKDIRYDFLTDSQKEDQDAIYLGWFGEALLYGATAMLMGIDLCFPAKFLFENEYNRLFANLGILSVVSILTMPAYFILSVPGVAAIGVGYIIIFISCIIYIILYLLTCCTNDCKDKCLVRVTLAIGIVVGGVITAIGYYVFAGGYDTLGDSGDEPKRVAFYVGYTILIGGLCSIWGLDIAFDDIKDN